MAFLHGKSTRVYLGAIDLTSYLNDMTMGVTADQADTTMFAATWKSETLGTISGTVGFGGLFDHSDTTLDTAFASAVPGVLTYCPGGGAAIGDAARLVPAIDVAHNISAPVGGMVAVTGSFDTSGVVGFGSVLHPKGADTGTTTGATKDELAATSTGWTAHLHVPSMTGAGSWVVTIQDSADGSTGWALVTGATFTAATTATSQRLTGAALATVKRYIRYVATVTGGTAPTITFILAFARN